MKYKKITSLPILAILLILLSAAWTFAAVDGPGPITARVDELFSAVDAVDQPGAAVVIVKDGKIEYERGYGMADLEAGAKITPSTIFHVGSVSKQFTAMAVQLLVREGKLFLDDDVRKFIPELHDFGKPVLVRHLLNHTSGLREQLQLLFMAGWRLEDVMTQEDILRLIWKQRELNFEPGTEYLYSNTNYTLLALIVERVSGKTLARYTEEKIFVPLGMRNTRFRDDHRGVTKNLALSYIPTTQGIRHMLIAGGYAGPAGLMTTAGDLALWDNNFYTGQIGGHETIERMLAAGKLANGREINYASGLNVGRYRGLKSVEHSGEDAGYQADFLQCPEQKFSVVVLSNFGGFDAVSTARQIADLYLENDIKAAAVKPPANPQPPDIKEIEVPGKLTDAYAGEYKLSFGIPLDLTIDSGRLTVQVRKDAKKPLASISPTGFVTPDGSIRIEFLPPENGKYIRLKIELNGQQLEGERQEKLTLADTSAGEYTGTYYSPELGAVYSLFYREGKLFLAHRRGEEPLALKHEDEFTSGFSTEARRWRGGEYARIKFVRDKKKHIQGFLLSMPTARNVGFVKKDLPAGFLEPG
jgi:CubicO group peptidase (beta-lactamase class C family)